MIAESFNQKDSDVIARYADINVVVTVTANAVWCYSEYSLGRTIAQTRPGFLALSGAEGASGAGVPPALLVTSNLYDTANHLVRSERWTSGVESRLLDVTLYTYDALGQPLLTCQDLDGDGQITLAGPDRVTGQTSRTIQLSGDWWRESASWTYPASGSAIPLTNAISRTRLTGLGGAYSADGATGILSAESVSIDHLGNQTTSRTVVDRDNKTVYRLTDTPQSTVAALATTVNGRLVSSRSTSGLVTSYTYDALGRQIATQDARGGIHSRGYDALGRVVWEDSPGSPLPLGEGQGEGTSVARTTYAYDSLGRRIAVTNVLGEVTHTEYDAEGRVVKTYGATYPVAYDYDAFGRMVSMKTFRDEQGAGDETRWFYEEATGLLTNKVYADGKGTAYSYTADGKLASRAWARGVTTEYNYTNGSMIAIDYSDATPAVTFAYDRLGRMTSAIVAGVSTNAYTYDSETLALIVETQNGMEITRTTDALGRDTGFSLDSDYAVTYGFDAYGRFSSLRAFVSSCETNTFAYSYLPNSDLISGMTASSGFLWTRAYEAARSLITAVENSYGSEVISHFGYENDELGRRTSIARSGLAFGDLPVRDAYGYNARSEVTSARRALADNPNQNVRGFSYDYEYDPIGNRTSSTEYDHEDSALVSAYTANELNQYGQRTVPGYAGVRGSATNTATVTVNANPAWRLDEYFYGGDAADNSADAVMKQLEITAGQSNLYSAVTGPVFVAKTPEIFTYDDDGNLTQDGRFGYAWNGENRLIKAETRDDLPTAVPRVKVEYAYDHQGRRVAAATSIWTNDAWQAVESRAFLYDGWNVVTELTHSQTHTLANSYVWGLDLSGSLQGAGGIGGLLAASLNGTTALYCYDANGNVGQLVASDGELLAHYEYSPFGETVVAVGSLAKVNSFRFSTKWFDGATGLGDWGYRWYSPGLGRWISRDPAEEWGGLHIYLMSINNPVARFDGLGLVSKACANAFDNYLKSNPEHKKIIDIIAANPNKIYKRKCQLKYTPMDCCDKSPEGGFSRGEVVIDGELIGYHTIRLCCNQGTDYQMTIAHELTHFFDECTLSERCNLKELGYEKWENCECLDGLCSELRAFRFSGECNDFESCWKEIVDRRYVENSVMCQNVIKKGKLSVGKLKAALMQGCKWADYPAPIFP